MGFGKVVKLGVQLKQLFALTCSQCSDTEGGVCVLGASEAGIHVCTLLASIRGPLSEADCNRQLTDAHRDTLADWRAWVSCAENILQENNILLYFYFLSDADDGGG